MTRHQKMTLIVGLVLVVAGIGGIVIRGLFKKSIRVATGDRVWHLRYDIDIEPGPDAARVLVSLPLDTPRARVFRQTLAHPGLSGQISRGRGTREQNLILPIEPGEPHYIRAEFDLHISPTAKWTTAARAVAPTPDALAQYLRPEKAIQSESVEVKAALESVREGSPERAELPGRILDHCSKRITYGDATGTQDAQAVLSRGTANSIGGARAMVALCRAAKIPARLVTGFEMGDHPFADPRTWMEAYLGETWVAYDPETGTGPELPSSFVPVRIGGSRIVRPAAGGQADVTAVYSIEVRPVPAGLLGAAGEHPGEIMDLTRFSMSFQHTMALLLVLPFGALVTAFSRNVVGLKTFGIFTPALIALSFIYADWITGLAVFISVMIIGVIGRSVFDKLKLLMVARLGLLMTLVVGLSAFLLSVLDFFGVSRVGETVLLPMVIVTLMVERAYIITEEDGARVTVKLLAGTLALAAACYLLMRWEFLTEWVVAYPEVHFITAGLLIWIGRYSGYRLTELWRFNDFGTSISGGEKKA